MGRVRKLLQILIFFPVLLLPAALASAEVFSPIDVELVVPQLPALGDTATVDCVIESVDYFDDVSVSITLSEGLELVGGSLTWRGRMVAYQQERLTIAVRVLAGGNHNIRADANARLSDDMSFGDTSQVFFHAAPGTAVVGHVFDYVRTMAPSVCLETGETAEPTSLAEYEIMKVQAPYEAQPCAVGPGHVQVQDSEPTPQGTVTVSGRWYYYDRDDVFRPMEWVLVELRRGDTDAVLASAMITDNDGQYTFPAVANPGAAGFRVKAWCFHLNTHSSDGKALRVVDVGTGRDDGGNVVSPCYSVQTAVRTSGDGTYDMGTWHIPNGSTNEPAWWIMMDLNKGFWWPYWWNDHTTMNGGVTVEWSSTSTHGDHNHRTDDGGNIHLKAESPNVCDVVLHEYGHEVQWDGYDQWLPTSDCPSPHYINRISASRCAWYEGFANWYKCVVSGDPVYHWASGSSINLETPTWGTANWDNGDLCEGRVCGAMWDIGDSVADGYDTCQLSWEYIWDTWYGSANRDNTFAQFWTRWKNRGNPKHHPVKALYQNTIDYNTAPTFGGLPDITTPEDTPRYNAVDLWAFAYDPESSDSELEYTIVANTNPSCGASISGSGYVNVVPAADWYGYSDVTIRCSDGIRDVEDTIRVSVTAVNDPPTLSGIPDRVVAVSSSNNNAVDLWLYTTDVDNSLSSLTYTIVSNTSPQCGAVIDAFDYIDINPTPGWMGYSDVTVRVTDPGGLWAEDTFRIVVAHPYGRISQARNNPDDTWVSLTGKVVTGQLASYSYIEETDRTAGVRIAAVGGFAPGQIVSVSGPLGTNFAERVITPYYYSITGTTDPLKPLAMTNDTLGGAAPDAYTPAVPTDGSGAYNVGLLVRTTGRVVSHASAGRFFISDGGSIQDNASGQPSVFVQSVPSGWQPPVGSHVTVTGISGASTLGGKPMRTLRPRDDSDVVVTSLRVAYIYNSDPDEAQGYKALLDNNGLLTDLIQVNQLGGTDLSAYQVIVIGTDATSWSSENVNTILAANTPIVARGTGGARFLDEVPGLFIGWGLSGVASGQTHAAVIGGDIYSYPYQIPYGPGSNIYVCYSPGVSAVLLYDPTNVSQHILGAYSFPNHYAVAGEQNRFYQWGFAGTVAQLTGWGRYLFVNLIYKSVRP